MPPSEKKSSLDEIKSAILKMLHQGPDSASADSYGPPMELANAVLSRPHTQPAPQRGYDEQAPASQISAALAGLAPEVEALTQDIHPETNRPDGQPDPQQSEFENADQPLELTDYAFGGSTLANDTLTDAFVANSTDHSPHHPTYGPGIQASDHAVELPRQEYGGTAHEPPVHDDRSVEHHFERPIYPGNASPGNENEDQHPGVPFDSSPQAEDLESRDTIHHETDMSGGNVSGEEHEITPSSASIFHTTQSDNLAIPDQAATESTYSRTDTDTVFSSQTAFGQPNERNDPSSDYVSDVSADEAPGSLQNDGPSFAPTGSAALNQSSLDELFDAPDEPMAEPVPDLSVESSLPASVLAPPSLAVDDRVAPFVEHTPTKYAFQASETPEYDPASEAMSQTSEPVMPMHLEDAADLPDETVLAATASLKMIAEFKDSHRHKAATSPVPEYPVAKVVPSDPVPEPEPIPETPPQNSAAAGSTHFDDFVKMTLRNAIQDWVSENMPRLVKDMQGKSDRP